MQGGGVALASLPNWLHDDFGHAAGLAGDVSRAGAALHILAEADADFVQETAGAGDRDGFLGQAGVGGEDFVFDFCGGDCARVLGGLEGLGDLDAAEGGAGLAEVLGRAEAGADAVLFPFVADEAAAGHDVHHLFNQGVGEGLGGGAELGPAAVVLRPEAMQNELVLALAAALGIVAGAGRGGAVLRGPGEGKQVKVEFTRFSAGFVSPLAKERRRHQRNQQKESQHDPTMLA